MADDYWEEREVKRKGREKEERKGGRERWKEETRKKMEGKEDKRTKRKT